MTDQTTKLEDVLDNLIETLNMKVKSDDCDASTLNVARQLLKDNGIQARTGKGTPLGKLADNLPSFARDETEPLAH